MFVDGGICVPVCHFIPRQQKWILRGVVFSSPCLLRIPSHSPHSSHHSKKKNRHKQKQPCIILFYKLQHSNVAQPQGVSHTPLPSFFFLLIVGTIEIKASGSFQQKQKLSLSLNFTDSCFFFIAQQRDERRCTLQT